MKNRLLTESIELVLRVLLNHVEPGWENCVKVARAWLDGELSEKKEMSGGDVSLAKMTDEEIAREAAEEIHWLHEDTPDAYEQEEAANTTKIILAAIKKADSQWRKLYETHLEACTRENK